MDHDLRIRSTWIGSLLGVLLMPLGGLLDWIVLSGDEFWRVFPLRFYCDVVLLIALLLLCVKPGRRHVRAVTALAAMAPTVTMCLMIYRLDGATSPYYAGLNLVIIILCLLLPFDVWEAGVYCLLVIASYLVACLMHMTDHGGALRLVEGTGPGRNFAGEFAILSNNLYFLGLTSVIGVTACLWNNRRRISEFQLRDQLHHQNDQLQELDRLKSRLLANVTHELRTPLTLILAPIEDMYRARSELPAVFAQALDSIRSNGLRLLSLINDLLDLERLSERRMTLVPKPVEMRTLVAEVVRSARDLAGQKGIELRLEGTGQALWLEGEAAKLERVVLNLVSNALKFTPRGGTVRVSCVRREDQIEVTVMDNGCGIPNSELPWIFDRFHQVNKGSGAAQQGTGLGLAVTKEFVELHGGSISVTSQLGEGSAFRIQLPADRSLKTSAPAEYRPREPGDQDADVLARMFHDARFAGVAASPETDNGSSQEESGASVLVVDDEPSMRNYLVKVLSREFRVASASDGETAIRRTLQLRPKVILLDFMLPDISGLEVCRRLRESANLPDLKILMLTAQMDETIRIQALQSGADDFLTKPFSAVELATRIRNLLSTACLQQDLRDRSRELEAAIASLKAAEAQLVQAEKMNGLGRLSGGLLHEINNPLNYMRMAVTICRRQPEAKAGKLAQRLEDIDAGIKRIEEIITGLRAFAYPEQAAQHQPFSFRKALQMALQFTSYELRDVVVELPSDDEDWLVNGSLTHVSQILVNLISNAMQAVSAVRSLREGRLKISAQPDNDRLWVRVWDNGEGIEPELQEKIFDPFFTTREVGQGTGLGLAICHSLARNHGGELRVRSQPGHWTEFSFDLAIVGSAPVLATKTSAGSLQPAGR